jgi:neutral ceramidase
MKVLRITGITLVTIIALVVVIYFAATGPVVNTPFYESGYFKKSLNEIDSLKKTSVSVNGAILAGFSKVSITPALGSSADNIEKGEFIQLPLAGFGARKGAPATGIHDSIFVKAAALKVENKLVVLVGADLLIMPPNITDSVMKVLTKNGITREQVFFSATHTHSSVGAWGPGFTGKQFAGENNKNVEKWLVQQITKAVNSAVADLRPAEIAAGDFDAKTYTRNRLVDELGTTNNDFQFFLYPPKRREKSCHWFICRAFNLYG